MAETFAGWKKGELQVHFIHTGVAESIFFILPDGTTMLVDCGDHPALTRLDLAVPVVPDPGRLAGDWIARYVRRVLPADTPVLNGRPLIDRMVLTHFHADHCGSRMWQTRKREDEPLPGCFRSGFALAAETLAFRDAYDRGWPDYSGPHDTRFPADELEHMRRLYAALAERDGLAVHRLEPGAADQLGLRRDPDAVRDFSIVNIAVNGCVRARDGRVRDLLAECPLFAATEENGLSFGMLVRYGKFSLYSSGDFSGKRTDETGREFDLEEMFAPELPPVDVAKINHHGHWTMPASLIRALSARVWTACVWDQLHVVDPVMERLADRSIYPGPRTFFPTVFPAERCRGARDLPFFRDVAPEVCGTGAHVVVTVPPGGETYQVACVDASNEEMRVLHACEFRSRG